MSKYDEDTFFMLNRILLKCFDCKKKYEKIILNCSTKVMSKGVDIYGMFMPDNELSKYFVYNGKITENENNKDYVYYFNKQNRLMLTERYVNKKTLQNLIFYDYYDNYIEIMWYCLKRNKIIKVGFIEYKQGTLVRFVESLIITKDVKEIKSYQEYVFNDDVEYITNRFYSLEMFSDKEVFETVSKIKKKY